MLQTELCMFACLLSWQGWQARNICSHRLAPCQHWNCLHAWMTANCPGRQMQPNAAERNRLAGTAATAAGDNPARNCCSAALLSTDSTVLISLLAFVWR